MRSGAAPHKRSSRKSGRHLRHIEGWEPRCVALPMLEEVGSKGRTCCAAMISWQAVQYAVVMVHHRQICCTRLKLPQPLLIAVL